MPRPDELKKAFEHLLGGVASDEERCVVQTALLSGRLVHAAGDRSVAIGGDAMGAVIITGDQAQVKIEVAETTFQHIREGLFPRPEGIAPPFPDLIFIGRENALQEVKALVGAAKPPEKKVPAAVVRGWPGVGKTTLVSVLSRDPDVARVYHDGVLWTSLDQSPALVSILAGWGRALGREDLLRVPTAEQIVQHLAALLRHKRMLLIVDDVWDAAHGALFQRARGSDCGLLITTREPEVAEALAATTQAIYTLPVLESEDALKLLRILAPEVVQKYPDECWELLEDLECLPLALHVAGRLLRAEQKLGWGVTDLLKSIREGAAVISAAAPVDRVEKGTIPTVAALLQKSTDRLDSQSRDCFAFFGAFAPKPATFDLEAMKAVWQVEDPRPIVRKLVARGLLEPVGDSRFQMHSLLVAHARSLLTP
jgi:NB-ARC domain